MSDGAIAVTSESLADSVIRSPPAAASDGMGRGLHAWSGGEHFLRWG